MTSKQDLLQAKMQETDEITFELTEADLSSVGGGGEATIGDTDAGGFAIRNANTGGFAIRNANTGGFAIRNANLGGFAIRNATLA